MTLEGCVVRVSDVIAYIGRDIEDAIVVGSIKREDIPRRVVDVIGDNNSEIVNTLILDIIENSYGKDYLSFSDEVFDALIELKDWSTAYIYNSKEAKMNDELLEMCFNTLFDLYVDKLKNIDYSNGIEIKEEDTISDSILYDFVNSRTKEYLDGTDVKRMVIDYMAGQTDNFFLRECSYHIEGFELNN